MNIKSILIFLLLFFFCFNLNAGVISGPTTDPAANSVPVFTDKKTVTSSPVTINPSTGEMTIPETGTSRFNNVVITNLTLSVSLGTDDTFTGTVIKDLNAGETITQWDLIRISSDGKLYQADANAAGEFPAWGIATAAGTADNALTILLQGTVRNDGWSWTVGGLIYLSTTAGGLTQTAPSTTGDAVQVVGVATTATTAYFIFTGYNTIAP